VGDGKGATVKEKQQNRGSAAERVAANSSLERENQAAGGLHYGAGAWQGGSTAACSACSTTACNSIARGIAACTELQLKQHRGMLCSVAAGAGSPPAARPHVASCSSGAPRMYSTLLHLHNKGWQQGKQQSCQLAADVPLVDARSMRPARLAQLLRRQPSPAAGRRGPAAQASSRGHRQRANGPSAEESAPLHWLLPAVQLLQHALLLLLLLCCAAAVQKTSSKSTTGQL